MTEDLLDDILSWNVTCSKSRDRSRETLECAINLIKEEVNELSAACDLDDKVEIADACADIIWTTVGLMYQRFGYFNTLDILEEVSYSNYSKLTGPSDDVEEEVRNFKSMGVDVSYVSPDGIIGCFQDSNGKVRKPSWYKAPDLKEVLRE